MKTPRFVAGIRIGAETKNCMMLFSDSDDKLEIVCNETNNTPEVIDANQLCVSIKFKPQEHIICVGDPFVGPWVECYPSGAKRHFSNGDTLVGGLVWLSQRYFSSLEE